MIGQASSTDVVASGQTGTVCQRSAPYKCNSHAEIVVFFKKGERFSSCPVDRGHATTWSVIRQANQS